MTTDGAVPSLMAEASSGGLYYEMGTAAACAQACARFLETLDVIAVHASLVQHVEAVSAQACGEALAARFNMAGSDLESRMKEHQKAVADLGEMFVQAERRYVQSDESAADGFTRLRNEVGREVVTIVERAEPQALKPTSRTVNSGRAVEVTPPDKPQLGKELVDLSGQSEKRYSNIISAVSGSSLSWDTLYKNRLVMISNAGTLRIAASRWGTMSDTMKEDVAVFGNTMDKAVSEGIKSPAGTRARTAVSAYVNSMAQLVAATDLMSDNLAFVYSTISGLYPSLPAQTESAFRAKSKVSEAAFLERLNGHRDTWTNWYPNNIDGAAKSVPTVPGFLNPVASAPAPLPELEQPGAGLGNGGGSPSSPGGGDDGGAPVKQPSDTPEETPATPDTPKTETPTTESPTTQTPSTTTDDSTSDDQTSDTTPSTSPTETTSPTTSGTDTSDSSSPSTTPTTSTPSTSPTATSPTTTSPVSALTGSPNSSKPGSVAAGGGGGVRGGGGAPGAAAPSLRAGTQSNLFPRAGLAASVTPTAGVVAASSGAAMPGAMGPAGAGAAGQGNRQDSHQRARYLDSAAHMDEGLGEAQVVVNPVIGEDPDAVQDQDVPEPGRR
ncbi:hypothetical protein ACFWPK_25620 [Nocardia sp. NPDC058519]|uniref:hypothetical protein n=1 Tax=Nocardia sp. NPDC058519 TaxID=3346535 RepID=UPI00364F2AC9